MPLSENNLIIHVKNFKDGWPLCWSMDKMGTFEGSFNEAETTCTDCIEILKE